MDVDFNKGPVASALLGLGAIGAANAVTTKTVMRSMGLKNERVFREMVEQERTAGGLILANGRGLFLPAEGEQGREEVARWIRLMTARITGAARTLKAARGTLRRIEGQQTFEEVKP